MEKTFQIMSKISKYMLIKSKDIYNISKETEISIDRLSVLLNKEDHESLTMNEYLRLCDALHIEDYQILLAIHHENCK